jgi:hypothetical protein
MVPLVHTKKPLTLYTEMLTADSYRTGFVPWPGKTTAQVVGQTSRDGNSTPPLPDHILEPLLATALFLVEVIGPPLVGTLAEMRAHKVPRHGSLPAVTLARLPKLRRALDRLRASKTPLPAGSLNRLGTAETGGEDTGPLALLAWGSVAQLIGCDKFGGAARRKMEAELTDLAAELGLERPWGRDSARIARLDNSEPVLWTEPLAQEDLRVFATHVLTACLTLVSALAGMRNSELRELSAGCRRSEPAPSGNGVRFKLAGKLIKRQKFGGVPDEWVVIEQVHRAVELAEQLQASNSKTSHPASPCSGRSP